jgi:hypothetical protein
MAGFVFCRSVLRRLAKKLTNPTTMNGPQCRLVIGRHFAVLKTEAA